MKKIGFPRMHKEVNEKRDFLPRFFKYFINEKAELFLEKGYGSAMGFTEEDYLIENPYIKFIDNKDCYTKDIVVVLRAPEFHEIQGMKNGSILISMLHYPTRKSRTELLKRKNIHGVSMDLVRNDSLERIIVNYNGTSGSGIQVAFQELSKSMKNFYSRSRDIINVSIIGLGMVGLTAAKAAKMYGSSEINERMKKLGAKGVLVKLLPRNITCDRHEMIQILKDTDILVDASTRDINSEYIIENEMIKYLKSSSVILDITADPYLTDVEPIQVKAIEGIPTGTLDKTVFYPDDDEYAFIPSSISTINRRIVVSCNAWPGLNALECMKLYGKQLTPVVKMIIRNNVREVNEHSDSFFMRAIYRGSIKYFEDHEKFPEVDSLNAI
ncbi:MAG: alanine dehydrogenase-like protein [Clostridiales bacterium]|jgi:alanine dehydrogenase|nr:alanine dehydrogenase-like protein [Clostridiales bacterium]